MSWHAGTAFEPAATGLISPQQTTPTAGSPGNDSTSTHRKRKRSLGGVDDGQDEGTTTGSVGDATSSPNNAKPRHAPGVKRACNDCRQQKLRCNVVAGPGDFYQACDRCIKHNLNCSIDDGFKRLGKRAAHEEMVKELESCKKRLAEYEALGINLPSNRNGVNGTFDAASAAAAATAMGAANGANGAQLPHNGSNFLGPNEAAASRSLLDLSQGYQELSRPTYPSIVPGSSVVTLGHVTLTDAQITELYSVFFTSYHPYLPLLNPSTTYKEMYSDHPLLHWTVVAVAARRYDARPGLFMELQRPLEEMLWTTLSHVPQAYHVCKALALLCTWPLPTSSTSQEPTMMLTGIMFQLAMQYGLHRPSHAQDFSRFRIELREEDIVDRLNTWAAVNIVAQNVSTGHGQPPLARWAWFTYGLHLNRLKPGLKIRCQIEKFCDTVTRSLFTMQRDHVVEVDHVQRGLTIDAYARELNELEVTVLSTNATPIELVYFKAAALHLRLTAFFDKPTQPNYNSNLQQAYIAAASLLTLLTEMHPEQYLFLPRYIEQMMLAAAITLLKLLNSFYAHHVDIPQGRTLFSKTVALLRKLSVRSNDLPQRLAEVTAQLWQSSGASEQRLFASSGPDAMHPSREPDESLQLRVRCRSSLSILFDAIWRWRERVGQAGRDNLAHDVEHPTKIQAETNARNTPQPPAALAGAPPSHGLGLDAAATELEGLSWDASFGGNAVFDTLSWALDGNMGLGNSMFGPNDPLLGAYQ